MEHQTGKEKMENFAPNCTDWEKIRKKISGIYGEWHRPDYPEAVNTRIPGTALLGNGDVGASSDGNEREKTFRISKGDFWSYNKNGGFRNHPISASALGGITLRAVECVPVFSGTDEIVEPGGAVADCDKEAKFYERQDILTATVITRQSLGGILLEMHTWVCADCNLAVMEITSKADQEATLELTTWTKDDNVHMMAEAYLDRNLAAAKRRTWNGVPKDPASWISEAVLSTKLIDAAGEVNAEAEAAGAKAKQQFALAAGKTVYAVTAVGGGGRTYDAEGVLQGTAPSEEAAALLETVRTAEDVRKLRMAHQDWWKRYWSASYIDLVGNSEDTMLQKVERYYYGAQYVLGSAARAGKLAPGLYGIWHTTDTPNWSSDYHLNYNFISPFYGVSSSNRPELYLPVVDALMQQVPTGIRNAGDIRALRIIPPEDSDFIEKKIAAGKISETEGIRDALLFTVPIGPWGTEVEPGIFLRETVCASYSAYPLIQYYAYTQDEQFLGDTLYPYLKKCVTFLESWLGCGEDRYTIYAGFNEGSWSKNPAIELAAYKNVLKNVIQYSERLNLDEERREAWKDMYAHLASQPCCMMEGKKIFSLAERNWNGKEWEEFRDILSLCGGNILPLECFIPGEVMGYYSSEEELQIARDTIDVFGEAGLNSINNFPRIYTYAIRARYPAKAVMEKLAAKIDEQMQLNLQISDQVHGIEKSGATECINNMLLQQDQGVAKLFPNWIPDQDAAFDCIRTKGAFVVSARYNGAARRVEPGVKITSKAGGTFVLASPWEGDVRVLREDGQEVSVVFGSAPNHSEERTLSFDTEAERTYYLTFQG